MSEPSDKIAPSIVRRVVTVIVCLAIVVVTVGIVLLIQNTEPKAQRVGATRKSEALVETLVVSNATYRPVLQALGTVRAVREIDLKPRVSGQIVEIASTFHPGGFVRQGEPLVVLDRDDFEHTLAMRESALHQAEAQLAIENGRRTVAEQEFALMDEEIAQGSRDLVLREPQLASARAAVESARAAVDQARLDLERTRIIAPFDAQVLSREVNVGSQVSPGDALARLVGVDRYWIATTVPLADLSSITLPVGDAPGAPAHVRHRSAWPEGVYRDGVVDALVGTLEPDTRMANVLVGVDDPLADAGKAPPLILGSIVEVDIEGSELGNVVRLARDYVRAGPSVWVYDAGELAIRPVTIVYEDAFYAYISEGLEDGDEIVITSLATVAPGIGLKRISPATGSEEKETTP